MSTESTDTKGKAAVADNAKDDRIRLRYLGDKAIEHSLTGLRFTKHVMHEMSRAEAEDLLHWTHGEEFEEIK